MSRKQKSVWWLLFAVIALATIAVAFGEGRTRINSARTVDSKQLIAASNSNSEAGKTEQAQTLQSQRHRARNLSLHPEAFNLGRRLGRRFSPGKREQSISGGTLTMGADRRIARITRQQTDDGEQVEIDIAGSSGQLTWSAAQGARGSGAPATGSDGDLIERLVFDSPDQFVLAQLRGASYYTVARNVRPEGAGDNYSGALWNIVRVDDPDQDEARRPQSRWRLYYLNVATGLIDRIESEVQGRRITAELTWTEADGEQVPSRITWTRQGQTLMQYRLTSFSVAEM